ncbi:MAG: glycosyltransferase family 4 protein [Candidatus Nitrospinota bacterium M3_3B_026]
MIASFVVPFYGDDIGGGAETQCRRLAENLYLRGVDVEVLTTTLKNLASDWNRPYWEPGVYDVNGVTVRRFHPRPVDGHAFARANERLVRGLPVTLEDEIDYMTNAVNSDALYEFIGDNKKNRYYFFIPYLFGLSLWGTKVAPERSILIPCLHDEGYARMRVAKQMFDRAIAALFNSRAEMRLAMSLYGGLRRTEPILMGEGVDRVKGADAERFREKHGLGDVPFILYVGRRDEGKNVPLLMDFFSRYKAKNPGSPLKFVSIGSGSVPIPEEIKDDTLDLGFVPPEEKADAYAAATALCQPSLMESFSLVIMESWLAGRPVLVHSACGPTSEAVAESGGGIAFGSFAEFSEATDYLLEDPARADEMGRRGREYAEKNYTWDTICRRFKIFLEALERAA